MGPEQGRDEIREFFDLFDDFADARLRVVSNRRHVFTVLKECAWSRTEAGAEFQFMCPLRRIWDDVILSGMLRIQVHFEHDDSVREAVLKMKAKFLDSDLVGIYDWENMDEDNVSAVDV